VTSQDGCIVQATEGDSRTWPILLRRHGDQPERPGHCHPWSKKRRGLTSTSEHLVDIYSSPTHVITYTNREVRQRFSICFARRLGGRLAMSDEVSKSSAVPTEAYHEVGSPLCR